MTWTACVMAAMVRELAPDLVIVQGAPRRFRWRTRNADLADRCGLVYAGGGEPSLGNLVLVNMRASVRGVRYVRFPLVPGQLFRGGMLARCSIAGNAVTVAGSQLATVPPESRAQAAALANVLSDVEDPLILGVDVQDNPSMGMLAEGRTVAGSAGRATIIVDRRITVDECQVVDTPAARRSGAHLPMVADLRLPPPG